MNIYHIRQILRTKSIYEIDLRVVYYARVSTEKEEQKNSIKNQREHFEEFIKSNKNWQFCGGYIDDGISGIHAEKREEFQRMIADAQAGKFDLIVTKEISRFARNTLDSIQYTRQLLSCGVCVWFQNDNINTIDDDSEFRLTIMAGVAQDEIRKLSSRVRFGHAQSIKNGVVLGNSHIYGYDKKDGRLTINEVEAPMIRFIFEKYATGEWSTPRLEKHLYEHGYRNYKGGKIDRGVIQHIITNPKYKGWYAGGKVKIVDMFTKKQEFLPENEWNMFKDDGSRVPAIVSEEIWERANQIYAVRGDIVKSRRTSFKNGNLFTGKIICTCDQSPYWMKYRHLRGMEDVKWVCSHKIKNGAGSCKSFYLAEKELCEMLADILCKTAGEIDDIVKAYLEIYEKVVLAPVDNTNEIESLSRKIAEIKRKKEKILDYNLNGAMTDEEFLSRNNEYSEQISKLSSRIAELEKKPDGIDKIKAQTEVLAQKIKECADIKAEDITSQVVENLINHIEVTPTGERKARIRFFLSSGEIEDAIYDKKMSCSGYIFLNMFPEQHIVYYRNFRSFEGHRMPIEYNYAIAI